MSEQQQETEVAGPPKASSVIATIVLVGVAGTIYWLGWGSEDSETPVAKPVAAPVPANIAPAQPVGLQPTIRGGLSARPVQAPFPDTNGEFNFGGVMGIVAHYDDQWRAIDQHAGFMSEQGYPRRTEGLFELKGKWQVGNGSFVWQETVKRNDGESVDYEVVVKSDQPVATNVLALGLLLPPQLYGNQQIIVDGKPLLLPGGSPTPGAILDRPVVKQLQIATPAGQINVEGEFPVLIQDNRNYGQDAYQVRIGFAPQRGAISEARLKLKMRRVPGALADLKGSAAADTQAAPAGPEQAKPQ